ncbi:MAG: hypothetical protein HY541_01565, partial [Deltaproteobacteria bacterium]|nr:hypothetical protein [Deltaproteobacteria bacterium]
MGGSCSTDDLPGFVYFRDNGQKNQPTGDDCINQTITDAEEELAGPDLTPDEFVLPVQRASLPLVGYPQIRLGNWTNGEMDSSLVVKEAAVPPLQVDSLDTIISVQTEEPLVIHLELPWWLDYRIQIDLGTLRIPLAIEEDHLLLESGMFIPTDGARIILSLDSDSAFVQKSNYEIPIRGIYLDHGHPVLIFETPNVHTSWFPEFIDKFFSDVLQEGVDFFSGKQYPPFKGGIDSLFAWRFGPELHQVPALEKLTDEKGTFKERIPLSDLAELSPQLRRLYNDRKVIHKKGEEPPAPGKEKKEPSLFSARWFAERMTIDTNIHSYASVSNFGTRFKIQLPSPPAPSLEGRGEGGRVTREAEVVLSDAEIFFDWDAPTAYEVRGKIPITQITLTGFTKTGSSGSSGGEEPIDLQDGSLVFRFDTKTGKVDADLTFAIEGFEPVSEATIRTEITLPNWEADKLDFSGMIEELSVRVLTEALRDNSALTRFVSEVDYHGQSRGNLPSEQGEREGEAPT